MPKPVDKGTTYVPGLDGLRTLAVTVVILYHLGIGGVPGGLLGVGVFFTLSGYLITANLMRSWDRRGNLGLKTFWLRRFRRLAPAMIVTVIAVLLLTVALDRGALTDRAGEGLSTFFYVNNWHTVFSEASYFDNFGGPGPLDHMWSLSVEEQFYLVWPLLLLALLFVLRKRRTLVAWATVLVAVASFAPAPTRAPTPAQVACCSAPPWRSGCPPAGPQGSRRSPTGPPPRSSDWSGWPASSRW